MSQRKINIVYSVANKNVAKHISDKLTQSGFLFNQMSSDDLAESESFKNQLLEIEEPCLLLISDNFLKSADCMEDGLSYLQLLVKKEQVLPIIIEGRYKNENGSGYSKVPTEFERVSNVIKYMNFWQDEYLSLRKLKRSISKKEETAFNIKLKKVRAISSEVGEFLRFLRESNYYSYEEFRANHFQVFFRYYSDEATHQSYTKIASKEKKLAAEMEEEPDTTPLVDPTAISFQQAGNPVDKLRVEQAPLVEMPAETTNNGGFVTQTEEEFIEPDSTGEPLEEKKGKDQSTIDTLVNEIEKEDAENTEKTLEEIKNLEERPLTETEQLALELSQSIPRNATPPSADQKTELPEEEEMISLEDLMGKEEPSEKPPSTVNGAEIADTPDYTDPIIIEDDTENPNLETIVEKADDTDEELDKYYEDELDKEETAIKESFEESEILSTSHALIQEGNLTEGMQLLTNALEEQPDSNTIRYQYAVFLAQYQNNFKEATNQLGILLEHDPENLPANFFLGELAEAERDYLSAKNYFEKVYKINAEFPNVQYKIGTLLANYLKENPKQAAQYLKKAYQLNPHNINALYQLGVVQSEELEQSAEAVRSFEEVLSKNANHPFANYDLALIYFNQNDLEKAKAYYKAAYTINPELKTEENDLAFGVIENEHGAKTNALDSLQEEINQKVDTQNASLIEEPKSTRLEIEANDPNILTEDQEIEGKESVAVQEQPAGLVKQATKIVLITGATSGIGKATAEIFAKNGYKLILTGRRFSRLFKIKEQFEKEFNSTIKLLPFDVRSAEAVSSALDELGEDWRQIDILINNAGLAKGFEPIHEGQLEDWETMIDTNVKGLLYMTRAIAPHMVKRKTGHIINICSIAGKEVYPNGGVYCATKHAVDALTKAMRIDLHKHHIRVSQVAPGHVEETEFALVRYDGNEEAARQVYEGFRPVNSQDVAEVIYFMASRPPHVNIQDVLMMGSQQASATITTKSGRS